MFSQTADYIQFSRRSVEATAAMAKISISLAVLLVLAQGTCAYIWERTKTVTEEERFQKIPPENETAIKFTKHFIGFDSEAIPPRAVSSHSLNYDAVFVIDSSKSITQEGHKKSLRSLRLLIEKTGAGPRFAAISYSSEATLRYNFTRKKDAIEKLNVREIPFEGGDTNTQAALDLCTTLILNPRNGARGGVPKRVLIITDGQSNMHKTKTLYRGLQLKNAGAQVFVIAVGKYIKGINEIVSLASSTDGHLYRVRDTNGLLRIVKLVPPWKTIKSFMQRTWLSQMLGKKPQPFSSREPRHHHKKRM